MGGKGTKSPKRPATKPATKRRSRSRSSSPAQEYRDLSSGASASSVVRPTIARPSSSSAETTRLVPENVREATEALVRATEVDHNTEPSSNKNKPRAEKEDSKTKKRPAPAQRAATPAAEDGPRTSGGQKQRCSRGLVVLLLALGAPCVLLVQGSPDRSENEETSAFGLGAHLDEVGVSLAVGVGVSAFGLAHLALPGDDWSTGIAALSGIAAAYASTYARSRSRASRPLTARSLPELAAKTAFPPLAPLIATINDMGSGLEPGGRNALAHAALVDWLGEFEASAQDADDFQPARLLLLAEESSRILRSVAQSLVAGISALSGCADGACHLELPPPGGCGDGLCRARLFDFMADATAARRPGFVIIRDLEQLQRRSDDKAFRALLTPIERFIVPTLNTPIEVRVSGGSKRMINAACCAFLFLSTSLAPGRAAEVVDLAQDAAQPVLTMQGALRDDAQPVRTMWAALRAPLDELFSPASYVAAAESARAFRNRLGNFVAVGVD